MFIWWRLPITAIPGPHLFDFGSFAEHADEIRLDLHQRLKLQNWFERNPADIMAQQEAFQTHSHNKYRGILQWVIETSIKGSKILMGTEKEEMIRCSSRCFLIFLWSEGTFGEWQMLRWPVSLRSVHHISFLVTHTGLSPGPPQTSSPADRVRGSPLALLNGLWAWASCPLRMCLLVICMYIFQLARGCCCTIIFWILSRQSLNAALTKPYLRFRKFYRERKWKIYSTINWQNNRQT